MASMDGFKITMSEEAKATLEKLAEALERFSALGDVFDRLSAAITAATEAGAVFSPVVVNNYHLQISEEDDPR